MFKIHKSMIDEQSEYERDLKVIASNTIPKQDTITSSRIKEIPKKKDQTSIISSTFRPSRCPQAPLSNSKNMIPSRRSRRFPLPTWRRRRRRITRVVSGPSTTLTSARREGSKSTPSAAGSVAISSPPKGGGEPAEIFQGPRCIPPRTALQAKDARSGSARWKGGRAWI